MLSVSVIVPILNAARTLPHCLAALSRLEPSPQEVILVDNGSTDESLHLLRAFAQERAMKGTQILEETRPGPSAARNAGIRAAKGTLIVFTDADCAPDKDWLRHLTEPFADPAVGAAAGSVIGSRTASVMELFSALYTLQLPNGQRLHKQWTPWGGGYPTANLAVRRTVLEELGGFEESMKTGEDHDLCARVYATHAVLAYTPDARVSHYHRTTLGSMVRQAFGFGRAHADLLRRHTCRGLWVDLPGYSLSWGGCPFRSWIDLASADKKVLEIVVLGTLYSPLFLLLPAYAWWLVRATRRRAKQVAVSSSLSVALGLAGLLLGKSFALTLGRWWGSVKYGALCF